tara:strand:+ start:498 stop:1220 length:723 start_codon:yes stop_codon:yes gene_type:complete
MKKTLIVIPTYFEKENIFRLITKIQSQKLNTDIIVVDDTPKRLNFKKNFLKKNRIKYINRKKKGGRGSAVITGFKTSFKKNYDLFVEMDADFSHNPNELKRNIKYFRKNSLDMLISSRYLKESKILNWPVSRKIFSIMSNFLTRLILPVPVSDYTNGYRLYSKRSIKVILNECGKIGDGFIVLSEILLKIYYKNYKIDEIKTIFINRKRGESSVGLSLIVNSLFGLLKLYFISLKIKKNS